VTQVKRFALAMLLMAFALVATAAPAFAQFGISSDSGQRRLLGMGIIALTLIIALLIVWFAQVKRNVDEDRGWLSGVASSSLPLGRCFWRRLRRKARRRQLRRDGASVVSSQKTLRPSPFPSRPRPLPPWPHYSEDGRHSESVKTSRVQSSRL